jgi:hypothetical protein
VKVSHKRSLRTFPVPPSPTRTSLKVGTPDASAMIIEYDVEEKRGKQSELDVRDCDKVISIQSSQVADF